MAKLARTAQRYKRIRNAFSNPRLFPFTAREKSVDLRSRDPKCMGQELPDLQDTDAKSKFGIVLDTDSRGLCAFKDSSFVIDFHPANSDNNDLSMNYELPWGADTWRVTESIDGKPRWTQPVGAPVQTSCDGGPKRSLVVCDVKQGRP
jgi:hypothetical protein